MFTEVSSSEIISYLAKRSESDNIKIQITDLRQIGRKLEEKCPSVIFDGDKYSIESFRSLCSSEIKVSYTEIVFNRSKGGVADILDRYQPEPSILQLLESLSE